MDHTKDFDNVRIRLASPERIREWSYGEVTKPETINYRTLRPERDGLFCERIFGTTKEWECYCGKFKSIRYKGVICDRCGVEVTHFRVRRERGGHINLATPVAHIWYYGSVPSQLSHLLGITITALKSVLYYESYIVTDPGETELSPLQILSETEYEEARELYGMGFQAGMGAAAVKTLLEALDLDSLATTLRQKMKSKGAKAASDKRLLKRLEIVESFRKSKNRPEWIILDVIPVIPPDLRPMVKLGGGRFATSDLNDLYRRVINRNNRLKRLLALNAPDIIIKNEKRLLQGAVDALFDNSKRKSFMRGSSSRSLKSLSDLLKGKQGRFRQNLLGKRVDYSGRSVIVCGPDLRLHQCGLPVKMALELYKPFIMHILVERGIVANIKKARSVVEQDSSSILPILEEVVKDHPVLLNRAPTLHRLGIQAFEPVLVSGKALKLHPLVCHAFNADFDGDQMAIHVPLTKAAQVECLTLMLSSTNLLDPANGQPIVFPGQDMVLGLYLTTSQNKDVKGEGGLYYDAATVMQAVEQHYLDIQAGIDYVVDGHLVHTTAGRVILNDALPKGTGFINEPLSDKAIKRNIHRIYNESGSYLAVEFLDAIKDFGFRYATLFGSSMSMEDILIPKEKAGLIAKANAEIDKIQDQYASGSITSDERYNRSIETWTQTNEQLTSIMMDQLKDDQNGFNSIYVMADSGARGSKNQIRQLAGMRGLMAKPSGDIIELPIRSNFKEGLSVIEFFISTNGARKGLADTALKTADAGYLTRRLVDIAQDVVVYEDDCGTINGIEISALKDGDTIVQPLSERVTGSFTLERVLHPVTGEIIVDINEEITDEIAKMFEKVGIESVRVRSVLSCEAKIGVCRKCYGRNLATGRQVQIGEAVGVVAAQSVGQPGTQLTMRTFHVGGVARTVSEENKLVFDEPVYVSSIEGTRIPMTNEAGKKYELFARKGTVIAHKVLSEIAIPSGAQLLVEDGDKIVPGRELFKGSDGKAVLGEEIGFARTYKKSLLIVKEGQEHVLKNGSMLYVKSNALVPARTALATFDPFSDPIIAEKAGTARLLDVVPGVTLREELNEETGKTEARIADTFIEDKEPRITVMGQAGEELAVYYLPARSALNVSDGQSVQAGDTLVRLFRGNTKTQDITGGLPRVSELFEARRPRTAAVLALVSGTVSFTPVSKGKRTLVVTDAFDQEHRHTVSLGSHLLVRNGDIVKAGEKLTEGSIDPHDVLVIGGERALQNFLLDEIQEVYRVQGVKINDKHISVIIRQMMKKVEITSVGDTQFILGQSVDRYKFREENKRITSDGGEPATARPMLLGISRASLTIDSWISAASFQETTRVLTNAAISGDVDYLRGLKENVVIGHRIPAGTGVPQYDTLELDEASESEEV